MARRSTPREIDPATGELALAVLDPAKVRQELYCEHKAVLRNSQAMRKLVLFGNEKHARTELTGKEDPQLQLALIARDKFLTCKNEFAQLGYLKEMRTLVQDSAATLAKAIEQLAERLQKDQHHNDKMRVLREKGAGNKGGDSLRSLIERAQCAEDVVVIEGLEDEAHDGL